MIGLQNTHDPVTLQRSRFLNLCSFHYLGQYVIFTFCELCIICLTVKFLLRRQLQICCGILGKPYKYFHNGTFFPINSIV